MKTCRSQIVSTLSFLFLCLTSASLAGEGRTLKVGPGQKYAMPSAALKAAKDGDTIEIDTKGKYDGDVTYVRASNLTIRGVGAGRALLDSKGKVAGRKGIFVTKGKDITIENIEFRNAAGEVNAAGIRAEGKNLTVRNCKFLECRDAILGGAGNVLIEYCEFVRCGHNAEPATHNLYISGGVKELIYRYNYSTHSYEGHLLKSRAKKSLILFNRLTDEKGKGSAVLDFPNGGEVLVMGNILHKGPNGQNNRVIAYAMEGIKHKKNSLHVVSNTIVFDPPNKSWFKKSWFIRTEKVKPDFLTVSRNNLCVGDVPLIKNGKIDSQGDLLIKNISDAGFVDAAAFDFRLRADSPAIGKGLDSVKLGEVILLPALQYKHTAKKEKRPQTGKFDVGALDFVKIAK
jgi:Right handed beta helix region